MKRLKQIFKRSLATSRLLGVAATTKIYLLKTLPTENEQLTHAFD